MTALLNALQEMRLRGLLAPLLRGLAMAAGVATLLALSLAHAKAAEPVKGEVKVFNDAGYVRLVFRLDEPVPAKVTMSGAIAVIAFAKTMDIAVDRINAGAPDYISAARRDPDGTAIRLALARKVKINTIPAGQWLYVDLLPENWAGVMPGLPQEVIDELARRASDAEKLLHHQRLAARQQVPPTIRVKVATQPTFVRYVFAMPEQVNVAPDRGDGRLTLNFDSAIKWDLADAAAVLPPTLKSIGTSADFDSSSVTFVLNGKPEVRSFREDRSIAVDVSLMAPKPPETLKPVAEQGREKQAAEKPADKKETRAAVAAPSAAAPNIDAPETVPANASAPVELAAPPAPPTVAPTIAPVSAPPPPAPLPAPVIAKAPTMPPPIDSPAKVAPPGAPAPAAAPSGIAKTQAPPKAPPANPNAPVVVDLHRSGDTMRLEFPFAVPTPTAVFRRADVLWLVFDTQAKIDAGALDSGDFKDMVRGVAVTRGADGEAIVRVKLARPQVAGLGADGPSWMLTIGDAGAMPTRPLVVARAVAGKDRASIAIPFDAAQKIHTIKDPDIGDKLIVITALGPTRGFIKGLDFVELRALPSTHGVVVEPLADDVTAATTTDRITISRPGGLTLSSGAMSERAANTFTFNPLLFDTQLWGFDREAKFNDRQSELIRMAASAPGPKRYQARLNLARFYLARDMSAEAKGVIEVALADQHMDDVTGTVLKGIADVMLDRPDDALKALNNPMVGTQLDAPIWRAVALARQGKWTEARNQFKNMEAAIGRLPIELQRMALKEALRSAIAVNDFNGAARMFDEFETIGVPANLEPSMAVLTGRLDEGLGRTEDALAAYRLAADSTDRRAAAQGRLREIVLHLTNGDTKRKDAITGLETLTTVWRGDETEVEGLKMLAHLYTEDSRYREAFHTMRTAMMSHPNSDLTRQIQDEAAATFDSLFLAGKGDKMPPVEALALFYDYRELTPIGRRGDDMIRKLADRLVTVDLLDQAAELLQHQIDHRLQGAARAQVASRLAVIYLKNHKADRALATLRSTRTSELSNELRDQRLLLEARALSEVGRHDVALEVVANVQGHEAMRLRSDILWAAKRWKEAAEQIELLYGNRWHEFSPLDDAERSDILRGAIAYALGDEAIGLARFRERYAAKMAGTPDAHAFDVVSAPIGATGAEFGDVAKAVSSVNTLDGFLSDMRKRYPDSSPVSPDADKEAAKPQAEAPQAAEKKAANTPIKPKAADAPKAPAKPDASPTGSIKR
jgi:tetratricopeptide (TPR) repeat protein